MDRIALTTRHIEAAKAYEAAVKSGATLAIAIAGGLLDASRREMENAGLSAAAIIIEVGAAVQ